jgi:IS30 family transposase
VERTTRYGRLIKLDTKQAEHVAEHLGLEMERLPVELAKTLTWTKAPNLQTM